MGAMNWSIYRQCILITLLILLGLFAVEPQIKVAHAQDSVGVLQPFWNITRGGPRADEGWGVTVDNDRNVYFTGFDRIAGATANVFLRKITPEGVEVWNTSWGGVFDDEAFIVTTQGEYVYVGGRTFTSFSLTSANMFVLKFQASNGSLVWNKTWDGGNGYDEVDGLVGHYELGERVWGWLEVPGPSIIRLIVGHQAEA